MSTAPQPCAPARVDPLVRACLHAAAAAPSVYNTQPWRFRVRPRSIEVLLDHSRRLDVIDPGGRELLISVGAAVFNLRVALLGHGRLPILRTFPSRDDPDLVAAVTIGSAVAADPTVRALLAAVEHRHTNRQPFSDMAVPDAVIGDLTRAALAEGATLALADPIGRDAILALTGTAEEWHRRDPAYLAELGAWTKPPYGRRDGVPAQTFGPADEDHTVPLRDFAPDQQQRRPPERFEARPTLVVLRTVGDTQVDWVRAGQALQRVLLTATVRGVATTPMTQALEIPELRRLLCDPFRHRYPQVILRIGYGRPAAGSPRRPLATTIAAS
jgi:nitroreductase